ncbi:MAG: hypothetical protein HY928_03420 [Elusimicrobia bacterium]|nr:hypothetical protein [Elusimicrobiota bacterium]
MLLAGGLVPGVRAEDPAVIQRHLENLKLGDRVEDVKTIYPPKQEWSKSREPSGGLERIIIQSAQAKYIPEAVESMVLGFKRGRLVRMEVVYGRAFSKKKPLETLVGDLSLEYGEPRRQGETYFWWDSATVLTAASAAQPDPSGKGTELSSTLSLMERGYFNPLR